MRVNVYQVVVFLVYSMWLCVLFGLNRIYAENWCAGRIFGNVYDINECLVDVSVAVAVATA